MALVALVTGVADLPHILLFLREMLDGIRPEIFDPLHAGELILVFFNIKVHNLLYNGKQPAMGLVHNLYANAEPVLPLDLLHDRRPLFCRPQTDEAE